MRMEDGVQEAELCYTTVRPWPKTYIRVLTHEESTGPISIRPILYRSRIACPHLDVS
jgi:hypothetical protein